jgi:hypothetical protein
MRLGANRVVRWILFYMQPMGTVDIKEGFKKSV